MYDGGRESLIQRTTIEMRLPCLERAVPYSQLDYNGIMERAMGIEPT